jgi:hypothetical protein
MFFWHLDLLIGVNQSRTVIRLPNGFVKHGSVLPSNTSPPAAAQTAKPAAF